MQDTHDEGESSKWATPRSSDSALQALPTELLVEIFQHLGWEDVFVIRRTCKFFFDLSTCRPLWQRLFHRLSSKLKAPLILERPICAYTAEELEHVVMRRISSETRWMAGALPHQRIIPAPDWMFEEDDEAVLLEGGRWFLTCSRRQYGRVYAYDLDVLSREPRCIVDLGIEGRVYPNWHLDVEVDRNTTPPWAFNLCLTPGSTIPPTGSAGSDWPFDEIHIYRLTVQGRGDEAVLEAHKIKALPNAMRADSVAVGFSGNYLIRSLEFEDSFFYHFEVCNWVLSDSVIHFKSYIECDTTAPIETLDDAWLIPDDKLLLLTETEMLVYNIANLHSFPAQKTNDKLMLQPYWRIPHISLSLQISNRCIDPYATRMAMLVDGIIHGLSVPHDTNESPRFQQISDINLSDTSMAWLGISKICAYDSGNNGGVRILNFPWPGDEDVTQDASLLLPAVTQLTEHRFTLPYSQWEDDPWFDESSNRILSMADGDWIVVDFASKRTNH